MISRRGHWEHAEVRKLNERILESLDASWIDCGHLQLDKVPGPELQMFQDAAAQIVAEFNGRGLWVVNDPRMSLLLDLWKPLLDTPVCVLVHRSPSIVARSISLRHGLPLNFCLQLWERYNVAALQASSGLPRTLIAHDQVLRDRFRAAGELHAKLVALGVHGLLAPPEAPFRELQDSGIADAPLSPQQSALALALQQGSAFDGVRLAPAAPVDDRTAPRRPTGGRPQPAKDTPESAVLKIKLLRRQEELQALRTEIAELRQRAEAGPVADAADRSPGVFVIGSPRSGTSVFAWALAQHPNFRTAAESDFLLHLFGNGHLQAAYTEAFNRADRGWLKQQQVDFDEFAASFGLGVEALFASRARGARWVDATPSYTLMVDEMLLLFPAASFLHIVRDGRAVVNSMISSGFDIEWAADFSAACQAWAHYALLGHRAAQAHPGRVFEVRHEDLTGRPGAELARVFAFLGDQSCKRSVNLITRGRINSSYGNVRPEDIRSTKDPDAAPQRPWESWSRKQHRTFSNIASEAMSLLGY